MSQMSTSSRKAIKKKSNFSHIVSSFSRRCASSNFITFLSTVAYCVLILFKIITTQLKLKQDRTFKRIEIIIDTMRKPVVRLALFSLLAIVFVSWLPLPVTAQKSEEAINAWADHLVRQPEDPPYLSLHYRIRTLFFSVDPAPAHPVVFLGDSITYGADWKELFPYSSAVNRGIGGDTTLGLLKRLDQIIALKPPQVFLMIGTNDLCYDRPIPKIVANYRLILERFREELPDTIVYVQSVLPFNDMVFPARGLRNNDEIRELNTEIRSLAIEYRYPYIDLTPAFTDSDGRLPVKYTSDGLHLSQAGYLQWQKQIQQYVSAEKKTAF